MLENKWEELLQIWFTWDSTDKNLSKERELVVKTEEENCQV